jgi:archaellum component FlaG (FlaF/FlaG flagellin family)
MKKVSSLLAILCITALSFAQTPVKGTDPAVAPAAKASKAQLEWSNGIVHDFGKITQNVPATYTFEFTNTGTEPVTITNAKPSCSCTVPEYSKEPVLPGKKGLVKTTYNAHNPGVFNKTITVTTDGGDNVILRISGEVFPKK